MFLLPILWALMGPEVLGADTLENPLRVGQVEIVSDDIFSPSEVDSVSGPLRLMRRAMNGVHVKTRLRVLRNELLFQSGDPFDPGALAETERNLRRLGFLNNVQVTSTDTTADGRVNVRVMTRDSWSLQTSVAYARSSGGETRWSLRMSDQNFLGRGVTIGTGIGGDENTSYWNGWFRQRRLWGTGLQLGVDYAQRNDGHGKSLYLARPYYAQEDPWTMHVQGWDFLNDVRYFLSHGGPAGERPSAATSLHARLPVTDQGFEGRIQLRISPRGAPRIFRLGVGLGLRDRAYHLAQQPYWELSDGRLADLSWLEQDGQPLAREQGLTVFPYLWFGTLGRQWVKARFIMQYGVVEDLPVDWSLELKVGPRGYGVGSTSGSAGASWRVEGEVNKWSRLGPGHLWLYGTGEGVVGAPANETWRYNLLVAWLGQAGADASPWLTRVFAEYGQGFGLTGDMAFQLGLNRGLRTLDFDGMAGERLMRWNLEQGRALGPEMLGLFKAGFAAFYSGGTAWWRNEDRGPGDARHEAGLGLRLGPTRSANSFTTRLDMTWALDGSQGPVFTAVTRGNF